MFDEMFLGEIRKIIREEIEDAMKKEEASPTEETYMSFQQVVDLTCLSASTVEGLIRRGELTAYYPTERRRTFKRSEVLKIMSKQKGEYDDESARLERTA